MKIIHVQAVPKEEMRGATPPILHIYSRCGARRSTCKLVLSWTCS